MKAIIRVCLFLVLALYACDRTADEPRHEYLFGNLRIEIKQIAPPDFIRLEKPAQHAFFALKLSFKDPMEAASYSPKLTESYWQQNLVFRRKSGVVHPITLVHQPNPFAHQQGFLEFLLVLPKADFKGGSFVLDDYVLNLGMVEMPF